MQESDHFIEETAQRPNIAFEGIRQLQPDLRAGVKWRAYFGVGHTVLADGAHIHVSDLDSSPHKEKISSLYIPMQNVGAV